MRGMRAPAFALVAVLLTLGRVAMAAEVNLWVIDDDPIPDNRHVTNLELFGSQQTMGTGEGRRPVEGLVALNNSLVYAPPDEQGTVDPSASHAYYLLRLPFTVHFTGGRTYDRLELRVTLADPTAMAFLLIPDKVVTERDAELGFNISAGFDRAGLSLGGGVSYVVGFKHIVPVVRAYGESSSEFYWIFEHKKGSQPLLGSYSTLVILRVPKDSTTVTGSLYAEALVQSRFPFFDKERVVSDSKTESWDLTNAEPFDAIPWIKKVIDASLVRP